MASLACVACARGGVRRWTPVTWGQRPDLAAGALRSLLPPGGAKAGPFISAQMSVCKIAGVDSGGFAGFRLEGSLGGSEFSTWSP